MRPALLLVCALTFFQRAEASLWANIGPNGGEARSLASDATGNTLFVEGRSGVFRSSSGGPWTLVFDATARGVTTTRVAVDRITSRVYIGTTTGLFRSDNGGTTWQLLGNFPIIDVTARSNEVIVSSSTEGLLRSTDGGINWTGLSKLDAQAPVSVVRLDPSVPARVAAAAAGNLFLSEDSGATWQQLKPKNIVAVALGDAVYAGGSDGTYACTDKCTQIDPGAVLHLALYVGDLYASVGQFVLRYTGSGFQFVVAGFPQADVLSLEGTPSALFAGTTGGVYLTTDGQRWVSRNEGLTNVRITAMEVVSGTLFAATQAQGLLQRIGGTWTAADAGLPTRPPIQSPVRALATNGSTLYAGFSNDGVFRSTDKGQTWLDITPGLPSPEVYDLAADGDTVVVVNFRKVAQSLDRGTTWQILTSYPALTASAVAAKGAKIIVADGATAWVSTDSGATWRSADLPTIVRRFAIAGDHDYAVTDGGVFVRTSTGWKVTLPGQVTSMAAVGKSLYVSLVSALQPSGIYVSDDGARWLLVPDSSGLPLDITALATDGAFFYAGTDGQSIFAMPLVTRRRAVNR